MPAPHTQVCEALRAGGFPDDLAAAVAQAVPDAAMVATKADVEKLTLALKSSLTRWFVVLTGVFLGATTVLLAFFWRW